MKRLCHVGNVLYSCPRKNGIGNTEKLGLYVFLSFQFPADRDRDTVCLSTLGWLTRVCTVTRTVWKKYKNDVTVKFLVCDVCSLSNKDNWSKFFQFCKHSMMLQVKHTSIWNQRRWPFLLVVSADICPFPPTKALSLSTHCFFAPLFLIMWIIKLMWNKY